jgi:hypothetical protein
LEIQKEIHGLTKRNTHGLYQEIHGLQSAIMIQAVCFLAIQLAVLSSSSQVSHRTMASISKFETEEDLTNFRWDAVSDVVQATNALIVKKDGTVGPADPSTWPLKEIMDRAHGNNTRITVALHIESKPAAASFFSGPSAAIVQAAGSAASAAIAAGYDGLQLDIEGLQLAAKPGLEQFVGTCATALKKHKANAALSVTVYGPKLVLNDFTTYNISRLAELTDFIFIMGYDMSWKDAKMGDGALQAGPNAPIDGLTLGIKNALKTGIPASSLVLGMPFYGRMYACDGKTPPKLGNCSCAEKNFKKKTLDLLATAEGTAGCFAGFNEQVGSPFWDCPHGSNITGVPTNWTGIRQQAWYENPRSIQLKLQLASTHGLGGVGVWSAHGCASKTQQCNEIWDLLAAQNPH